MIHASMDKYTVVRSDGTVRSFSDSTPAICFLIKSEAYTEMFDLDGKKVLQKGVLSQPSGLRQA